MSRAADVLRRAADLIEPEGAWTQGALARSKDGRRVSHLDDAAECWCLYGAIARAAGDNSAAIISASGALWEVTRGRCTQWNDAPERTQTDVVVALRAAAERAA